MNKITLAIPFYNTSKYFMDCIKYSLEDDFIEEIVVNDDHSSEEEWENLNNIIKNLNTDKIKLFRNEINLGGFKNKYVTVAKCNCEWIYLLDSDNHLTENTLSSIRNIENPDLNICYAPKKLIVYEKNDSSDQYRYYKEVLYNFPYEKIGINESKEAFGNNIQYFDWLLNTGNFVVNRNSYLNVIKNFFENYEETYAGDVIAFSYEWMKSGKFYKIVPDMEYFHRLRKDSYWNCYGNDSQKLANHYTSLILKL